MIYVIRISVSSKGFAVRRFTAVLWSPPRLQGPPATGSPVYKVPGPQVYRRQVSTPTSRLTVLKPYKFKKEFPTAQHPPERNPLAWDFRRGTRRSDTNGAAHAGATPAGAGPSAGSGVPREGPAHTGRAPPPRQTPSGQTVACSTDGVPCEGRGGKTTSSAAQKEQCCRWLRQALILGNNPTCRWRNGWRRSGR